MTKLTRARIQVTFWRLSQCAGEAAWLSPFPLPLSACHRTWRPWCPLIRLLLCREVSEMSSEFVRIRALHSWHIINGGKHITPTVNAGNLEGLIQKDFSVFSGPIKIKHNLLWGQPLMQTHILFKEASVKLEREAVLWLSASAPCFPVVLITLKTSCSWLKARWVEKYWLGCRKHPILLCGHCQLPMWPYANEVSGEF